ncbi:MAG: VWA domain-containing protein, partial [Staphylothermus sp.]|nr:VWA domain-containing protein [Staphylothermus sp.]
LIRIGYHILKYSITGRFKLNKKIRSLVDGRIDTRRTIFNIVRYNYEITRVKAKKTTKISALVDISGSMTKHSLWAILSLAQIIPLVKVVVLFSENTRVVKMPKTSSRKLIMDFLEQLYSSFGGYTNISKALRDVAKYVSPNEIIVVFSDLEQTVPDIKPWEIVKELISKHNASIVFFVPPNHRTDIAEKMKSIGCEVIVAKSPESIGKWLKRRLNFKIRHKIIHVRGTE